MGTSVPGTSVPGVPRRPRPNQRCYLHPWCRFCLSNASINLKMPNKGASPQEKCWAIYGDSGIKFLKTKLKDCFALRCFLLVKTSPNCIWSLRPLYTETFEPVSCKVNNVGPRQSQLQQSTAKYSWKIHDFQKSCSWWWYNTDTTTSLNNPSNTPRTNPVPPP